MEGGSRGPQDVIRVALQEPQKNEKVTAFRSGSVRFGVISLPTFGVGQTINPELYAQNPKSYLLSPTSRDPKNPKP